MDFAGDYKLESIVVHSATGSIDIKALMLEMNIYESIHSPNLSGSLVVADTGNHIQNMPIIGQEDIEFILKTNDDTEAIDFSRYRGRIYKVSDMVRTAESQQVYTIHFCSKEMIRNQQVRVKAAYQGAGDVICEAILVDVLKSKKPISVEKSDLGIKLLGNNMKPFGFLQMMAKRCRSTVNEDAGFLFYETHRGYNLRSYSSLCNKFNAPLPAVEKYIVQPSDYNATLNEDMQSVIEYRITKNQDVLAASATGLLASRHLIYDLHQKKIEVVDSDYETNFGSFEHMEKDNPGMLFTNTPEDEGGYRMFDFPEQRIKVSTKDTALHTQSTTDERNFDNHSNQHFNRLHNVLVHDQIVAKVTVAGNSNLAAGDVIELHVPSYEPVNKEDDRVHDAFLSGRWVITKLVHAVSTREYTTTFDCVKDTVTMPYAETNSTIASKTNYEEKESNTNEI